MQFNRLSAFTLGVIITAASVGAVSYANAAGNKTLKACANKKTGAMRYISNGSCKKTETSLSWSQMGIQGLPGVPGAKGDTGATSSNGTNGTNGTAGANGQNYFAVDATGKTFGPIIGNAQGTVEVLVDQMTWSLYKDSYVIDSTESNSIGFYSDANCASPYLTTSIGFTPNPQGIVIDYGSNQTWDSTDKAYKGTGAITSWIGRAIYYFHSVDDGYLCTAVTDLEKAELITAGDSLYPVVEVTKPTYTPPLTIVAK